MSVQNPFLFCDSPEYNIKDVFCVRLDPTICKEDMLLEEFFYLLWFPGYFGFNWNALYDCLKDFHWMPFHKVVLIHETIPDLPHEDLKIYIDILRDSVLSWKPGEEHSLEVVFKESHREAIEKILTEIETNNA